MSGDPADGGRLGIAPPYLHPPYVSTRTRAPARPLVLLPGFLRKLAGPVSAGLREVAPGDADLTRQHPSEPLGQGIVVAGRVRDEAGRPLSGMLIEVWQANAAGRYAHDRDRHDAPLDPNFSGVGRCLTDAEGGYRFVSIKPGAYPWANHANAWRPSHIHFSLFGAQLASRLVTQMYFPGDPLLAFDPIFQAIPDPAARRRLVAELDLDLAVPGHSLGYRFDITLRGRGATPLDDAKDHRHARS